MLSVIRPDFDVVKEGQILHLVSGSRSFVVSERIMQGIKPTRQAGFRAGAKKEKNQVFIQSVKAELV